MNTWEEYLLEKCVCYRIKKGICHEMAYLFSPDCLDLYFLF